MAVDKDWEKISKLFFKGKDGKEYGFYAWGGNLSDGTKRPGPSRGSVYLAKSIKDMYKALKGKEKSHFVNDVINSGGLTGFAKQGKSKKYNPSDFTTLDGKPAPKIDPKEIAKRQEELKAAEKARRDAAIQRAKDATSTPEGLAKAKAAAQGTREKIAAVRTGAWQAGQPWPPKDWDSKKKAAMEKVFPGGVFDNSVKQKAPAKIDESSLNIGAKLEELSFANKKTEKPEVKDMSPRPKITTLPKQKPLSKYQQSLRGLNQKDDGTLLGKMKIGGVQQQIFRSKDGKSVFYRNKDGSKRTFVSGGKVGVDNWVKRSQSSGRLDQSRTAMAEQPRTPHDAKRKVEQAKTPGQQQQQKPKPQSALAGMRDTVQGTQPQPGANVTKPPAQNAGANQAGRPQQQAEDPRRKQMLDAVAKQQGTGAYANKPKPQGMTPAQKDALDRRNRGGGGGETTGEEDTGEMPVGVGGGGVLPPPAPKPDVNVRPPVGGPVQYPVDAGGGRPSGGDHGSFNPGAPVGGGGGGGQGGGRDSLPPNLSPHVMDGFGGDRRNQVEPVGMGGISPLIQNPGGGLLPGDGGGSNVDTGGLSSGTGNPSIQGFLPSGGYSGASGPNNQSWWNPVSDLPTGNIPYYGPRLPWGKAEWQDPDLDNNQQQGPRSLLEWVISEYQRAHDEGKKANLERYDEIVGDREGLIADARQDRSDIEDKYAGLRRGAIRRGEGDIVTSQGAYNAGRQGVEDRGQGRLRGLMQGYQSGRQDLANMTNQNVGTLAGLSGANVGQIGGLSDAARQGVTGRYAKDQQALAEGFGQLGQSQQERISGDTSTLDQGHQARSQALGQGYGQAGSNLASLYGSGRDAIGQDFGAATTGAGERYGGRLARGLELLKGLGAGAAADIAERHDESLKSGLAGIKSQAQQRGLGNTTISGSMQQGLKSRLGKDRESALGQLRDSLIDRQAGMFSQLSGDRERAIDAFTQAGLGARTDMLGRGIEAQRGLMGQGLAAQERLGGDRLAAFERGQGRGQQAAQQIGLQGLSERAVGDRARMGADQAMASQGLAGQISQLGQGFGAQANALSQGFGAQANLTGQGLGDLGAGLRQLQSSDSALTGQQLGSLDNMLASITGRDAALGEAGIGAFERGGQRIGSAGEELARFKERRVDEYPSLQEMYGLLRDWGAAGGGVNPLGIFGGGMGGGNQGGDGGGWNWPPGGGGGNEGGDEEGDDDEGGNEGGNEGGGNGGGNTGGGGGGGGTGGGGGGGGNNGGGNNGGGNNGGGGDEGGTGSGPHGGDPANNPNHPSHPNHPANPNNPNAPPYNPTSKNPPPWWPPYVPWPPEDDTLPTEGPRPPWWPKNQPWPPIAPDKPEDLPDEEDEEDAEEKLDEEIEEEINNEDELLQDAEDIEFEDVANPEGPPTVPPILNPTETETIGNDAGFQMAEQAQRDGLWPAGLSPQKIQQLMQKYGSWEEVPPIERIRNMPRNMSPMGANQA